MRSIFKTILAPAPVLTLCLALLGTIPAATPANASWWNPFSWWSSPATCSFAPDTAVLMGDGSFRPIASLNIGDVVASRSEESGLYANRQITNAYSSLHQDKVILHLARADGSEENIITTTEHPFHVKGKGFVPAGRLKPGMALSAHRANAPAHLLLSANRSQSTALVVNKIEIQQKGANFRAYNLSIAKDHTFFVGSSKVWVHNACEYKKRKSGQSGKEAAKNVPSWALGKAPYTTENGRQFAKRLCDEKYGEGNYQTGPNSEFNQIKKYGDRGFE